MNPFSFALLCALLFCASLSSASHSSVSASSEEGRVNRGVQLSEVLSAASHHLQEAGSLIRANTVQGPPLTFEEATHLSLVSLASTIFTTVCAMSCPWGETCTRNFVSDMMALAMALGVFSNISLDASKLCREACSRPIMLGYMLDATVILGARLMILADLTISSTYSRENFTIMIGLAICSFVQLLYNLIH
jgi:hypothetical protein